MARFAPDCPELGGDAAIRSDPTFTRTSPRLRSYAERKLPQTITFAGAASTATATATMHMLDPLYEVHDPPKIGSLGQVTTMGNLAFTDFPVVRIEATQLTPASFVAYLLVVAVVVVVEVVVVV